MRTCKDGRIWGQNNKEAGNHLGISLSKRAKKGKYANRKGELNPFYGKHHTIPPMLGKHHSIETRRKLSEAKMGAKHPHWKGGVSSEQKMIRMQIEARLWREAVFARDNWTCRKCRKQGGRLSAHHIKSFAQYPELRFAIDNGETLCSGCHKLTDNYRGRNK